MPCRLRLLCPTLLGLLFTVQAAIAAADTPRAAPERPAQGLIVRMKSDATAADWERMARAAGMAASATRERGARVRLIGADRLMDGAQARELAQRLSREPGVDWVEPNTRERRLQAVTPSDSFFPDQWWLKPVSGSNSNAIEDRLRGVPGFQTAWSQSTGNANTVVAVLDTGYTVHPELAVLSRVFNGYDFVSEVDYANDGNGRDAIALDPGDSVSAGDLNNPLFSGCVEEDSSWHGTIIAGQLAALTNNDAGVAAMQWDGKVVAVRVAGKCGATVTDIVDGMRWAAGLRVNDGSGNRIPNPNPARVITISFGGDGDCRPYQDAINDVRAAGAIVVAAAGNENGKVLRPAKCPGVIGVGAVNRDGFKTTYSNFGPELSITTVGGDPGTDGNGNPFGRWGPLLGDSGVLTVYNLGRTSPGASGYAYVFGTSFSTPIVAGAASLMLAVNPALTADELIDGIKRSARPHVTSPVIGSCSDDNPGRCICTTNTCGAGLLDVDEALRYAANPAAYSPPARIGAVIDNAEVRAAAALGPDLPPNDGASDSSGGGSGGALGWPWLVALAAAVWAARRSRSP